jgi:hypothetical protein
MRRSWTSRFVVATALFLLLACLWFALAQN